MKRTISILCAAVLAAGTLLGLASTATAAPAPPLVNTSPPKISGIPRVGDAVTASRGAWQGTSGFTLSTRTEFSYQWLVAGTEIPGATAYRYTPVPSDVGSRLSVRVTATRSFAEDDATATSAQTIPVLKGRITGGVLSIAGRNKVFQTLTASSANWVPSDVNTRFAWYVDGQFVHGCVSGLDYVPYVCIVGGPYGPFDHLFEPKSADLGKRLKVVVTATKDGYTYTTRERQYGVVGAPSQIGPS